MIDYENLDVAAVMPNPRRSICGRTKEYRKWSGERQEGA